MMSNLSNRLDEKGEKGKENRFISSNFRPDSFYRPGKTDCKYVDFFPNWVQNKFLNIKSKFTTALMLCF